MHSILDIAIEARRAAGKALKEAQYLYTCRTGGLCPPPASHVRDARDQVAAAEEALRAAHHDVWVASGGALGVEWRRE